MSSGDHECLKRISDAEFGFSVGSLLFAMKTLVWCDLYQVFVQCYDQGLLQEFEWEY